MDPKIDVKSQKPIAFEPVEKDIESGKKEAQAGGRTWTFWSYISIKDDESLFSKFDKVTDMFFKTVKVLHFVELGRTGSRTRFAKETQQFLDHVDGVRLFYETRYFFNGDLKADYKDKYIFSILASTVNTGINVLTTLDFVQSKSGLSILGPMAKSIGSIRIFSFVAKTSLEVFIRKSVIVLCLLAAMDAIQKFQRPGEDKKRLGINFGYAVAEIAFQSHVLSAGSAVTPTFVVYGGISAVMGASCMIYDRTKNYRK